MPDTGSLRFLIHQRQGHPELACGWIGASERQHTDDGVTDAVQIDVAANDGSVRPEIALPSFATDDGDMVCVRVVVLFHEGTPQRWLNPEKREQTAGCQNPMNLFCMSIPNQRYRFGTHDGVSGHLIKARLLRMPIQIIGKSDLCPSGYLRMRLTNSDNAIGVLERQRSKQHRVRSAKYRRCCSDPECECQDGSDREAGRLPKTASGEPDIVPKIVEV